MMGLFSNETLDVGSCLLSYGSMMTWRGVELEFNLEARNDFVSKTVL